MAALTDQPQQLLQPASAAAETLNSLHADYVQDIAFDFYGRRIATCSGDRTVRVWDLDENGDWTFAPGSEWRAHRGSVTRLAWAHPEFGQLLVTGGADHAATVWEEREAGGRLPGGGAPTGNEAAGGPAASSGAQYGWVAKARLTDARRAVTCVQFAPRHLGLRLATGSADGTVRIYEAIDVMNLNHWPLNGSIEADEVEAGKSELGVTSLSWCNGRFEPPTIVVGGSSGNVNVYRYSDASRQWHLTVRLPPHGRGTLDVAWAPNVGRSYHLIASAGMDGGLKVHRLKRGRKEGTGGGGGGSASSSLLELDSSQSLDAGNELVWRCEWNVTGTVLASSGDGGSVRLWKSDFRNNWRCVSEVQGDVSAGSERLAQQEASG